MSNVGAALGAALVAALFILAVGGRPQGAPLRSRKPEGPRTAVRGPWPVLQSAAALHARPLV